MKTKNRSLLSLVVILCAVFMTLQVVEIKTYAEPPLIKSSLTSSSDSMTNDPLSSESSWSHKMKEFVQTHIDQIAAQEPIFAEWQQAAFHIQPVGPGLQEWIVVLTAEQREVGYLIIGLDEEMNFVLIEYGQALEQLWGSAKEEHQNRLLQHFAGDFSTIYSGLFIGATDNHSLINYRTGEEYEHVKPEEVQAFWQAERVQQLLHTEKSLPLAADPIVFYGVEHNPVTAFDSTHSYMFVAQLIPRVTGLYSVYGWHQWAVAGDTPADSEYPGLYIGLVDEGIRYFSASYLQKIGSFQQVP